LVFEVADRELDDDVLAMLGFDDGEWILAVGREGVVLPGRQFALALRVRTRRTISRLSPSVVSVIWAMLVGG
jgi:hypothetical protein